MRLRPDLADAARYVPGASVPGATKLASNESPDGPLPGVVDAVDDVAAHSNIYPDPGVGSLRAVLAQRHGVDEDTVVVGNGSVSLCQLVVQATCSPGDAVVFAWRAFEAYPIIAAQVLARAEQVPLDAQGRHDLPAMAARIRELEADGVRVGCVFICNPNNPTGTVVSRAEIEAFLDAVPSDITVVLDEAYREFNDQDFDGMDLRAEGRGQVVVLRTFSKAYGLAALRVGYGFADPALVGAVGALTLPFSVNATAQRAAEASLDSSQEAELSTRLARITSERERMHAEITALGLPVLPSKANFLWLGVDDPAGLDAHLRENLLIVRPFPEGVRITIGTSEQNDRVLAALRSWTQRG